MKRKLIRAIGYLLVCLPFAITYLGIWLSNNFYKGLVLASIFQLTVLTGIKIIYRDKEAEVKELVAELNILKGRVEEIKSQVKTTITAEGLKLGDMNIEFGKKEDVKDEF